MRLEEDFSTDIVFVTPSATKPKYIKLFCAISWRVCQ
jgi:hypothetical protein